MLSRQMRQRGDTLVEVLLAIAVMTMVVTVSWRTMNIGFGKIVASSQRSEVQAQMYGQLALLRAAHDKAANGGTDANDWNTIKSYATAVNTPNPSGCTPIAGSSLDPANKFYFDTTKPSGWTTPTPKGIYFTGLPLLTDGYPTPGTGMWIEVIEVDPPLSSFKYYDFYVKACWMGPASSGRQESKTVMRLYDV